jgi:CRISPR-associated protein (TIGR03986 family)
LAPANDRKKLSPADRVFGWVSQESQGAYRGHVRIGHIRAVSAAISTFDSPRILPILGAPKPQQGRFYVARDNSGAAQESGLSRESAGYNNANKRLRGRKVYPHHRNTNGSGMSESQIDQTKQNRSVREQVNPDSVFEFDIHFHNLSAVELGALKWLLELPPDHFHRLGLGKPLGYGSVRLDLTAACIHSGGQMKKAYESLEAPERCEIDIVNMFVAAVESAYKKPFNEVSFIAAFLRAAEGFGDGLPVHYPRTRLQPQTGDGSESYEWFVANDKSDRHALPDLANDAGLPYL